MRAWKLASFVKTGLIATAVFFSLGLQSPGGTAEVPYASLSPRVAATTERTAVVVLQSIAQARSDIHHRSLDKARKEVADARRLIVSMKEDLSTAVARGYIGIARKHLEFEPSKKVVRDLPPIFNALDRIEVYIPTDKAKRHLELARTYLEKNEKESAARELALADRSLLMNTEVLPVLKAEKYVAKAQEYLSRKDGQKADRALQMAERVTGALTVGSESPLSLARKNFSLAFHNYSTSRLPEAKSALQQARAYLEKARQSGNTKGREEAGKLAAEVGDLEKKIETGGEETGVALKSAWERCEALAERSAEYLASGWQEEETTLAAEDDLIEAKLHLSYAETYQITAKEPEKAVKELSTADTYLKKAMHNRLADKATQNTLREIGSEVMALRATPEKTDSSIQDRYENIKDKLSDLLVKL